MINFQGGGGALINQWYKGIEELKDLGQQPKKFMEKTIFKEIIQDIAYNPILAELEMIDPTVRIEQVRWKFGNTEIN